MLLEEKGAATAVVSMLSSKDAPTRERAAGLSGTVRITLTSLYCRHRHKLGCNA